MMWSDFIQEGRKYYKTARNGRKRREVFTNELTCNLIGLSMEKLLVGLCMQGGVMPTDHTLSGIIAEVQGLCGMDEALADAVRAMDRTQDLCSMEVNTRWEVSDSQIDHLLEMNARVAMFVVHHLGHAVAEE